MVPMSDEDDFMAAMGDVKPLSAEKRVQLQKAVTMSSTLSARRESAVSKVLKADPLVDSEVKMLDPLEVLSYQRPGVQHGVFRQLRLGRYAIDARLDLHRMTVEQARGAVWQFIKDCQANDIRCGLITHGKGQGRQTQAVLKSHLAHWLPQIESVLAYHSAQPSHGGLGACYVMVKKSDRKRQENREKHQR